MITSTPARSLSIISQNILVLSVWFFSASPRMELKCALELVGDLDPHLSPYTLTPLKLVYKKLRLLVDRGCIFIGHGLSKDFRIIST
jgi:hypothetical protein